MRKALGIIVNVLFVAMLMVGAALIVLRICGFKILAIETGSMGENYPVGSLIITDGCSPEEIRVGDVISFVANEKLVTVTHRVVEIDDENRCFYTKGDANNTADSNSVSFENLIGKEKLTIPHLGYALIWVHTTWGKIVLALDLTFIAVCVPGRATYKKYESGKWRKNE